MIVVLLVISFILSCIVVNWAYKVFMKMVGANVMFYKIKNKGIAIFIVTLVIFGSILQILGLNPNSKKTASNENTASETVSNDNATEGENSGSADGNATLQESTAEQNAQIDAAVSSEVYNDTAAADTSSSYELYGEISTKGENSGSADGNATLQEGAAEQNAQTAAAVSSRVYNDTAAADTSSSYGLYGEISTKGGNIVGFSTSYVCNNGSPEIVRKNLGDGWHIKAVAHYYSYNIDWYELYDADDGDYYGWVDGDYINWY